MLSNILERVKLIVIEKFVVIACTVALPSDLDAKSWKLLA